MKFIAVLHQSGGCDYTIECGTKIIQLKAKEKPAALKEIEDLLRGDEDEGSPYAGSSERALDTITLYEVAGSSMVDVQGIYARIAAEEKAAQAAKAKKGRKAEFEKLKKEFGE